MSNLRRRGPCTHRYSSARLTRSMESFMDTLTAIHSRRTIHKYTHTRVPETIIDQCIDAAHQAPNHKLTCLWHFVVVGEVTRQKIYEMAVNMRRQAPGMTPEIQEKLRAKFLDPGGMVFVSQTKCTDPFREREDYAATACAIQTLCSLPTA